MTEVSYQYARRRKHIQSVSNPFDTKWRVSDDIYVPVVIADLIYTRGGIGWFVWPLTTNGIDILSNSWVSKRKGEGGRFEGARFSEEPTKSQKLRSFGTFTITRVSNILFEHYRAKNPWI